MYTKKQRSVAAVICIAFILVTLFSVLFIAKEANHDCSGESCPICEQLAQAEHTLKRLGSGTAEAGAVTAFVFVCFMCLSFGSVHEGAHITPVTQKVRMNN